MLIRLWCWLFGHKTITKAYTGNKLEQNGAEVLLYKYERQKFCIHCERDM